SYADLREEGPGWIAESTSADQEPRIRTVAVVALEMAHIAFDDPADRPAWQSEDYVRRIIGIGCEWVRSRPVATEFDRVWMLASIALIHSVQNVGQTASFDD